MADDRSALILSPEAPYPVAGGGANRSAALVEQLASRYRLDAIVFREPETAEPARTRLGDIAHRVHTVSLPVHRRGTPVRALRNLRRLWRGAPPLTSASDATVRSAVIGSLELSTKT